jgi:hypothetical protein
MSETVKLNMTLIFRLILDGGDTNKRRVIELIRALSPEVRRDNCAACQRLNALVQDVWFDEMRRR